VKSRRRQGRFLARGLRCGSALACIWPILLAAPPSRQAEAGDAVVVTRVYDGDTVEVRRADGTEKRVRLIGIDSPEMDDERETVLFFAHMAKRFAFYHLYDKNVRLTYDQEPTDAYGRTLAYVSLEDGTLFNELIIKEGFAHAFTKYPYRDEMKERFRRAERYARRYHKGLWREKPWPVVAPGGARARLGSIATVRFVCREVEERGRYVYLRSGDDFEVFVQEPMPLPIADLRALSGRPVSITGFVEDFRGRTQVVLTLPSQLVPAPDAGMSARVEAERLSGAPRAQ
jgi:micrococcal nuclease